MPGMCLSTKAGGMATGMPDTGMTSSPAGPVPIPYPNIATWAQANPGTAAKKVKIVGQPAIHIGTMTTMSSGDEAGNAPGGVISATIKGPMSVQKGSFKTMIEGQPAMRQGDMVKMNLNNVPAAVQSVPSQPKVTSG
ncbi:MAG: DUF4150 domain-containing protein [Pseudomonadota bacterium]